MNVLAWQWIAGAAGVGLAVAAVWDFKELGAWASAPVLGAVSKLAYGLVLLWMTRMERGPRNRCALLSGRFAVPAAVTLGVGILCWSLREHLLTFWLIPFAIADGPASDFMASGEQPLRIDRSAQLAAAGITGSLALAPLWIGEGWLFLSDALAAPRARSLWRWVVLSSAAGLAAGAVLLWYYGPAVYLRGFKLFYAPGPHREAASQPGKPGSASPTRFTQRNPTSPTGEFGSALPRVPT